MLRGVIFDLDNTLVDSRLDFDQMRADLNLPKEYPILEALVHQDAERARHCQQILLQHEAAGAERATLLPGVAELLAELRRRELPLGIITRNSRQMTVLTLKNVALTAYFRHVITRDDGPVKPDPWGVHALCDRWQVAPELVTVIGDYRFDVEAGRAAGARTVILTHPHPPHTYSNEEQADLVLHSLRDWQQLLAWWDGSGFELFAE